MIKSVEIILPTNSTDFAKVLEHDTLEIERTGRIPTDTGSLQLLRAIDAGNGRIEINAFYFTAANPGMFGTGEEFTKIPGFAFETLPLAEEKLRVEAICYHSALEKHFDSLLAYIKNLWPQLNDSRINRSLEAKLIKVLFLAANPLDTINPPDSIPLRLDEEIRAIDDKLQRAKFRDLFEIRQHWAVRVADVQECFLRHEPHIVHFSGHGSRSGEIILEDNSGNSQAVSVRALSSLFSVLKDNIRCVILNACYSEQQAQAIAKHIDCVVGMSRAITDPAAISFAASFYQALGYGRSIKTAFDLGCGQIDMEGLDEQETPKLLAPNCDPDQIVFVTTEKVNSVKQKDEEPISIPLPKPNRESYYGPNPLRELGLIPPED